MKQGSKMKQDEEQFIQIVKKHPGKTIKEIEQLSFAEYGCVLKRCGMIGFKSASENKVIRRQDGENPYRYYPVEEVTLHAVETPLATSDSSSALGDQKKLERDIVGGDKLGRITRKATIVIYQEIEKGYQQRNLEMDKVIEARKVEVEYLEQQIQVLKNIRQAYEDGMNKKAELMRLEELLQDLRRKVQLHIRELEGKGLLGKVSYVKCHG